ncbi:MAG: hypothetical protein V3R84_00230 [Acidimicrobiia bacterium]
MADVVVFSQVTGASEIDWVLLVAGLVGGLAIFLLGMDRMTESLRLIAGDRMRKIPTGILPTIARGRRDRQPQAHLLLH